MQSIRTLAGGNAHELNNALSPILTTVELLQMRLNCEIPLWAFVRDS
ncbi:MAG TPA: hypothetical protein VI260_26155 [Blastocatellia bacterium]|jgi:hypothetical protein